MINRGLLKKSQYVFNAKTGMLEKKEKNTQTIESLSKQKGKDVKDLLMNEKAYQSAEKNQPISQITVITTEDSIIHNYFYGFEYSWDAANCLSSATMKMPKMNEENINYWSTYQGTLTVYGGYNLMLDKVNKKGKNKTEQEIANSMADIGINSDIQPFFRGTVSRIKEYQTHIVLYLDSIGVRFKQKIPDQFRQSFINNQNVRDAFQAICEFIGVDFICPPQTETPAENQVATDGTENNVGTQEQTMNNVANAATNKVNEMANSSSTNTASSDTSTQINQQELLSNTQNANTSDPNNPTPSSTTAEGTENATPTDEQALTNNKEIDVQLNGFADINFDANGAIVHGSTAIETSPDMADTLAEMAENPLEKYLEDETGVIEKVQAFLDGDMFEELHNNVMDYNAITIEPKSTTTSNISSSTVSDTNVSNGTENGENPEQNPENNQNTSDNNTGGNNTGDGQ